MESQNRRRYNIEKNKILNFPKNDIAKMIFCAIILLSDKEVREGFVVFFLEAFRSIFL